MNDPQWLEASRRLAERVIHQSSETGTRASINLGEVLLARAWEPREKLVLEKCVDEVFRAPMPMTLPFILSLYCSS